MAKAIKTFAVNTTTGLTVYTVPANTSAKVILGALYVSGVGPSISFGYTVITPTGTTTLNGLLTPAGAMGAQVEPYVFYLTEGQIISVTSAGPQVAAQICVIEEAS